MTDRRAELAAALEGLHRELAQVCNRAGRAPSDVQVIAVTKTWPASDVALLAGLGVTDVGENRHQEALDKHAQVRDAPGLRWHHIGALQSNKARAVTTWADVVQGLDRASLLAPLAAARPGLEVLVQVSLDGDPARGGCPVSEAPALAREASAAGLTVRGVMAVAPLGADPADAFARLAGVSREVRAQVPAAAWISAGMSGDWPVAVAHGATHLRLGSVLMGRRSP